MNKKPGRLHSFCIWWLDTLFEMDDRAHTLTERRDRAMRGMLRSIIMSLCAANLYLLIEKKYIVDMAEGVAGLFAVLWLFGPVFLAIHMHEYLDTWIRPTKKPPRH